MSGVPMMPEKLKVKITPKGTIVLGSKEGYTEYVRADLVDTLHEKIESLEEEIFNMQWEQAERDWD